MSEYIVRMPPDMPYEIRAELNAWYVESEPIVRCRDCKCFIPSGYCAEMHHKALANGFCSWGERRDA